MYVDIDCLYIAMNISLNHDLKLETFDPYFNTKKEKINIFKSYATDYSIRKQLYRYKGTRISYYEKEIYH